MLTFDHYKSDPYFNMAFDEWMFQKVINGQSLICVRLYTWSVGTITFGFNQQQEKAYINDKVVNTPVIRRVTGGRGLYHDESELTYSIAVSADLIKNKVISNSISDASAEIAVILIDFLNQLSIVSDYVRNSSKQEQEKDFFHKAPCFASFSKNEIISQEEKIIASAQRRVSGALLQHGSIKINGVKEHDALQVKASKNVEHNKINKIIESDFYRYAGLFFNSFVHRFDTEEIRGEISECEKPELEKREKLVVEKSLEKRDFIKQTG